jgi:hypothetical protein
LDIRRHIAALSAAFVMSEPVAGAVAERSAHETVEAILEWLIGGAPAENPVMRGAERRNPAAPIGCTREWVALLIAGIAACRSRTSSEKPLGHLISLELLPK